jgi:hypothetical protein
MANRRAREGGFPTVGYNVHIVKSSEFVRLNAQGRPDLAETRRALEVVARRCVERKVDCALIDGRDMRGTMTVPDFYELIGAFYEIGFRQRHRLALLHGYTGAQRAALFAACAESRGWDVRAFESFEGAMEWFNEGPTRWWLNDDDSATDGNSDVDKSA